MVAGFVIVGEFAVIFALGKQGVGIVASNWNVRRGAEVSGPFSSKELRNMASSGTLRPSDEVKKGEEGRWKPAGSVAGLFGNDSNPTPPVAPPSQASVAASTAGEVKSTKPTTTAPLPSTAASTSFPMPLMIGGGIAGALLLLMCTCCIATTVLSSFQRGNVAKSIDEANELYDAGEKEEAVKMYRKIIDRDLILVDDSQRSKIVERTFAFEVENNQSDAATKLLERADAYSISVVGETDAAREFADGWRAKKEAERERLAATKLAEAETNATDSANPAATVDTTSWGGGQKALDFLDHPSDHQGANITMQLMLGSEDLGQFMQDGKMATSLSCQFTFIQVIDGNFINAEVEVILPSGLKCPPIRTGESAVVAFECRRGRLDTGNFATSLARP